MRVLMGSVCSIPVSQHPGELWLSVRNMVTTSHAERKDDLEWKKLKCLQVTGWNITRTLWMQKSNVFLICMRETSHQSEGLHSTYVKHESRNAPCPSIQNGLVISTQSIWASSPVFTDDNPVNMQQCYFKKERRWRCVCVRGVGVNKNSFYPLSPYPPPCISHLYWSGVPSLCFALLVTLKDAFHRGKEWASSYLPVVMEMGPISSLNHFHFVGLDMSLSKEEMFNPWHNFLSGQWEVGKGGWGLEGQKS